MARHARSNCATPDLTNYQGKPPLVNRPYSTRSRIPTPAGDEPSLTRQSFKDECDINKIMSKYIKTGEFFHLNPTLPQHGFAPDFDFSEAMEMVQKAQDLFDDLPANVRERFDQNPAKFIAFCENPANRPEMAALGLLDPSDTSVRVSRDDRLQKTTEPLKGDEPVEPEPRSQNSAPDQHS